MEVGAGGAPFEPAQAGAGGAFHLRLGQRLGNAAAGVEQGFARVRAAGLGGQQQAMLAAQLGHHQLARPRVAKIRVCHSPALRQADRRVVVGGAEHDRHLPAGARAEQQGGGAGLGQLDQHGAVEPGAGALDH